MAPEYAMRGNFSVKSDVYSFGDEENMEGLISFVSINIYMLY